MNKPRVTKKSLIRDYLERERPARIGREEAAAIRRELGRALGPRGRISDNYLLDVLVESGAAVTPELGGFAPELLEALRFETLEAAEDTLRALDRYSRAGPEAAGDSRRAAMLARRRATMIARNRHITPEKRALKEEIAQWLAIWLETPDLFFDWLALRKRALGQRE